MTRHDGPPGGGLILAAGSGRRFGADKRRARLADGRLLIEATLDAWHPAVPGCRVVLRDANVPDERALAEHLSERHPGLQITFASGWQRGMGASLAAGIADCAGWDWVLVGLGDMPDVRPETLTLLAERLRERVAAGETDCIVRPRHDGCDGHPVGFGAAHFHVLATLDGDRGARDLVAGHGEVLRVACDDPGVLRDVDTPAEL